MKNTPDRTVLVIDDEPGHRLMVRAVLGDAGWHVEEAPDAEAGLEKASEMEPDVILLDMRMPGMDGLEALRELQARRSTAPVVMLTAFGTVGSAVEAMKKGAFDYLTKPTDNDELEAVLEKAWQYSRLLDENERLRRERDSEGPNLIGSSRAMESVRRFIEQVGPSEATVLIRGESGTGKELVAEGLHTSSRRSSGPLIKVNCAALPTELLESELFGYDKGAFTGATRDKPGRFLLARGGTLFLDEVAEMPSELQAKLLRALQERVVEPLGSVQPVETDVRILAATNRDLVLEVEQGRFREDLYYRLNVLEVEVPPLRERMEDLPELAGHLLAKLGEKNRKSVRTLAPGFMEALAAYDWPGNVRELENVLERALILARSDTLTPDLLPDHLLQHGSAEQPARVHGRPADNLDDAERQALIQALDANDGHRARTADALGISRRTLQYKLKKHGLTRR